MTPTIVAQDGKPILLVGSPGGRTIINTVLQIVLNVIEHEMAAGSAVEAARMHHQWLPNTTVLEEWGFSPDSRQQYESMGHALRQVRRLGSAQVIFINRETGRLEGVTDSRTMDGGAAGY